MTNDDKPSIGFWRHPWWIGVTLLAVVVLIYAGLWFYLALGAREQLVQWVEQQRERGFAARYDSLEVTGFPLSIRLELANPGFGAPNAGKPWGWEGAHLNFLIKPWSMNTIRAMASGQQMLAFPLNGKTETFTGEIVGAEGEISFSKGKPASARLSLVGVDLRSETPSQDKFKFERTEFSVVRLNSDARGHRAPTWNLKGSAQTLSLPWLKASPLGNEVQNLIIDGRLMGSLDKGPMIEQLENWRDSGGTIEVRKLSFQNGPLKINTDGTLALDGLLQPIGALTARVEGFFETIDALQRLDVVKARDAITAKMVLGILARKPENGGPATLNLALTLQKRRLYAGPVGLLKIPEIQWRELAQ